MSQRPLFDPKKMAVARDKAAAGLAAGAPATGQSSAPAVSTSAGVLTVSALASVIDAALRTGPPHRPLTPQVRNDRIDPTAISRFT